MIYLNASYLYKQAFLLGKEKVEKLNAVSTIYKDSDNDTYQINNQELEYIRKAVPIVDSFFNITEPIKFDIYFQNGNCSASTLTSSKLIIFNDCPEKLSPFVHEYIHIIFGIYDELWFNEGFATYLSLLILSQSNLEGIKDQNTDYFFDAWFNDYYKNIDWYNREKLCYIDDLKIKYTRNDVSSIVGIDKKWGFWNLEDPVEFYRLSAAFCEFLSKEMGIRNLIDMAHLKTSSNKSITNLAQSVDVDLKMYFEKWLLEFKNE